MNTGPIETIKEIKDPVEKILKFMVFWPSDELAGSIEKVTTVEVGGGEVYLIGLEDILLDRLCSAKHWKYDRGEAQALSILSIYGEK